jgi:hypothetical protein
LVVCKKRSLSADRKFGEGGSGQPSTPPTRLIVYFLIGYRTLQDARGFLKGSISRTKDIAIMYRCAKIIVKDQTLEEWPFSWYHGDVQNMSD